MLNILLRFVVCEGPPVIGYFMHLKLKYRKWEVAYNVFGGRLLVSCFG